MNFNVLYFISNTNLKQYYVEISCSEQLLVNLLKNRHLFTVQFNFKFFKDLNNG